MLSSVFSLSLLCCLLVFLVYISVCCFSVFVQYFLVLCVVCCLFFWGDRKREKNAQGDVVDTKLVVVVLDCSK